MKKLRSLAPFLMLLASAIAGIIMFRGDYDTNKSLVILLCVMIVFYGAGCLIQKNLISFVEQIQEREAAEAEAAAKAAAMAEAEAAAAEIKGEGEVIEKEIPVEESSVQT